MNKSFRCSDLHPSDPPFSRRKYNSCQNPSQPYSCCFAALGRLPSPSAHSQTVAKAQSGNHNREFTGNRQLRTGRSRQSKEIQKEAGDLCEYVVNLHCPAGDSRLRLRCLAPSIDDCVVRITSAIDLYDVITEQIYIPYYQRSRGEAVGTFCSHLLFGGGTVIILASDLGREHRCALQKLHSVDVADIPR